MSDYKTASSWASIGAGVMARAVFTGAADSGLLPPSRICFSDINKDALHSLQGKGFQTAGSNGEAVRGAEYVLLAVKPPQAPDAVRDIAPLMENKTLVSICAGVKTDTLAALLPKSASVVRVMPNLPFTAGCGASVVAENPRAEQSIAQVLALFSCGGLALTLPEDQLDAVTAVSGSGPGYFFKIAAIMQDAAGSLGLDRQSALLLIAKTMEGAAKMLQAPGASPRTLAEHVAVPEGTTEAAFKAMERHGFTQALTAGMTECAARASELGKI